MKLADALVNALNSWKITTVFGVSGANIEHLHDAIFRASGEVKSVLAKTEMGAAFMADAQARVFKTLGVCCATSGGGMMNLAVGIAESHADRVPVLAIVGQIPTNLEGRGGFQDSSAKSRSVNAFGLFQSIAKFVARIDQPSLFWPALEQAVFQALNGVRGPAVLLIPRDAFEYEVSDPPSSFPLSLEKITQHILPDAAQIKQLFSALRQASCPVIIVGNEFESPEFRDILAQLAMNARIPVATTMSGPTAFFNDHPLYLGCVGTAGYPSAHTYLNERADLIVGFGTTLDVMTRQPWAKALERAQIVAVASDTAQVAQNVRPSFLVQGDPLDAIKAVLELYAKHPFTQDYQTWPLRRYFRMAQEPGKSLLASEAIALIEPHLPTAGHVFFDAGNCASAAIHGLRMPRDCQAIVALGMGGMGYAIAGAVGAQLKADKPSRSVVISGDGSFLMLGFEVHTAAELQLPILFIFFNDAKHGMCVTRQQVFFEGRIDATTYNRVDIAAVAQGLAPKNRLWVRKARTSPELKLALLDFQTDPFRTGVLEIELIHDEMPPFAPFLPKDAETFLVE